MLDCKGRPVLGAPRKWPRPQVARGVDRAGKKRILLTFDAQSFEEVRDAAAEAGCSFAQVVREAVECWLEDRQHG